MTEEELKHQKQLDSVLMETVDQIWDMYDADGNGILDMAETRSFMKDYIGTLES